MTGGKRDDFLCSHSFRHSLFVGRGDHPIFAGDLVPRRFALPCWDGDLAGAIICFVLAASSASEVSGFSTRKRSRNPFLKAERLLHHIFANWAFTLSTTKDSSVSLIF
jgi:hypothetical protein